MGKKIVVIGGSAAGPKAAARARRLDSSAEITIIQKAPDLSMASCGYPYYVGGVVENRDSLLSTPTGVIRNPKFYEKAKGITALVNTEVTSIDFQGKTVTCRDLVKEEDSVKHYDRLIISTGSIPNMPPVPGVELEGIHTLQSMQDADELRALADSKSVKHAVIVGCGLIGVETCEALRGSGMEVTLVERLPNLLMFLDAQPSMLVENHIRSKGVKVITGNGVAEFCGEKGKLTGVRLADGTEISCELALVAVGVRPNTELAASAGIEIGETGGILVDDYMKTSVDDVYAVGDCVEVTNRITGKKELAPYGDLANLQGRVAGENAVLGDTMKHPGVVKTGICKVFDFQAGSTGLKGASAEAAGIDSMSVVSAGPDKPSFMGGKLLIQIMTVEKTTGRLLGLQCVGPGDAGRQLAEAAIAITGGLTVDDLVNLDLPYAPSYSPAIDNMVTCSHVMQNKLRGLFTGISPIEVKSIVDRGEDIFIIDTRGPDEFEVMRLGIGEKLIPLGALRSRMDELPRDKSHMIICFCKISLRGYEASRLLQGAGYTNVKVMEGGVMGWPFARER